MDKNLTNKLMNKYEFLRPMPKETQKGADGKPFIWDLKLFGLMCNNGWYHLLDELCAGIQKELDAHPELKFHVVSDASGKRSYNGFFVAEVKEKYAGLRFYADGGDEVIDNLIHDAELRSMHVCEQCGAPGELKEIYSWYYCVCPRHEREITEYRRKCSSSKA